MMVRIIVAMLVAFPVLSFSQSNNNDTLRLRNPNGDPVIIAPDSFDLRKTYLVEEGSGWTGVQPYSDAQDCASLAAYRGDKCITGAEAKTRFGLK